MDFRVDISEPAEADVEHVLAWIRGRSEVAAEKWFSAWQSALGTLRQMPNRCSIAPETHSYLIDVRHLLFGEGSMQHRIIFGVSTGETLEEGVVTIYRVRNSKQRPLSGLEIFGEYDDE